MDLEIIENLQFLTEKQYWMYGPCFQVMFHFRENRCSPKDFEKILLADPMVYAPQHLAYPISDMPGRCVLATGNGDKPLGFGYFGGDWGSYDYYRLSTYPRQINRHCGDFCWNGNADDPHSVIQLHSELILFVRRLHAQLNFHLVIMRDEGAPWPTSPHKFPNGILIYHWLAQQGNFGSSQFVDYCYALLPFTEIE